MEIVPYWSQCISYYVCYYYYYYCFRRQEIVKVNEQDRGEIA